MYVGSPTQSPSGPSCATVFPIASKIFLYGILPSEFAFIFYNFVLALSKGRLMVAATAPAKHPEIIYASYGLYPFFVSLSLDSSYVVNIPKLRDIALTTVGTPPFQRLVIPSSYGILLMALNTEV